MREQRYKHKREEKLKPFGYSDENKYIKDMEEDGWELVSIINTQNLTIYPIVYYWKRELKEITIDKNSQQLIGLINTELCQHPQSQELMEFFRGLIKYKYSISQSELSKKK